MVKRLPSLNRLKSDPAYAQRQYEQAYGTGRKPLDQLSADYRRRVLKALSEGKSKSEARGHAPVSGQSEYQRRKARLQSSLGITPSQYSSLRAEAKQSSFVTWDDITTALQRGVSPAEIRQLMKDQEESADAFAQGNPDMGRGRFAIRMNRIPIEFYFYHRRK